MAEIPIEMMTLEKPHIHHFDGDEQLYYRFHYDHLEDGGVSAEAFRLPNMSVNRSTLGPPSWTKVSEDDEYVLWGVACFRVKEIPTGVEMQHLGVMVFTFRPEHVPLKKNYPHSEIWVFRDGLHICRKNKNVDLLAPEFHLRWRERLSQLGEVIIQPTEE
jgi:hypothetical protein